MHYDGVDPTFWIGDYHSTGGIDFEGTIEYSSVVQLDAKYLPIDNDTITVDTNGKIAAKAAKDVDLSRVDQDVNIVNGHNLTVDGDVTINGDLEFNGDIAFGNIRSSVVNADEMYVAGKKVLVEGDTVSGGTASFPTTASDGSALQEGAVLVYRGGQWVAENPPTVIYTGEVE
jgi:hypothetical protein